jgi:prepilin-type N-terminal cleavage/methylation domain-containing protein
MRISSATVLGFARPTRGFTLIEMLMTIAIIGFIASIAVPNLSSLHSGEVKETRHRRNAQEIASVFVTAQAAGLNFAVPGSLEQTVRNIAEGGSPSEGPFRAKIYAVKGLLEEDITGVQRYLTLSGEVLSYNSRGS